MQIKHAASTCVSDLIFVVNFCCLLGFVPIKVISNTFLHTIIRQAKFI